MEWNCRCTSFPVCRARVTHGVDGLPQPRTAPLPAQRLIRRVVVDATAAAGSPLFARAAVDSGTQDLIDPMT